MTDNSERIDRFLREQMSPEENDAFLRDLDSNEALREEAQLTALMIQELHDRQKKQDAEIIAEVLAAKAAKKAASKAKIIRLVKWVGSVAAMLILVFGVYLYQKNLSDEVNYVALADKYYKETPITTYRSNLTDADKELADLFHQVGTADDIVPVVNRLQVIYDNVDAEYAYRANGNDIRIAWHLALAYLKNDQPDKASKLLRTIIQDDKGTDLREKAKDLLIEIEDK